MKLIKPQMIPQIDAYLEHALGCDARELMRRSAEGVKNALLSAAKIGSSVVILAGGGNNGGDGYALAHSINDLYSVVVYDVFGIGQRSEAGKHHLALCLERGVAIERLIPSDNQRNVIMNADVIIDAVFGTGVKEPYPELAVSLMQLIGKSRAKRIAVDVPLGVSPETGAVNPHTPKFDITVELSCPKVGLYSCPAALYTGRIVRETLGACASDIAEKFGSSTTLTTSYTARELLPKRPRDANKGSLGRATLIVGSEDYVGAGILAAEAALRSGVGYTVVFSVASVCDKILCRLPEVICNRISSIHSAADSELRAIASASENSGAILIGSGLGKSEALCRLVMMLLNNNGAPIILDADAINSLAEYGDKSALSSAKRRVIITPHPKELSRLSGISTEEIQNNRLGIAEAFAKENKLTLLLKGAATVVTDGTLTYINSSGSSALAKAGTGDVLSGLIASLVAQGAEPTAAAALGAYLHGSAADTLALSFSEYGVLPSELPLAIAGEIAKLEK